MEWITWLTVLLVLVVAVVLFVRMMSANHNTFKKMGIDTPPGANLFGHFALGVEHGMFKCQTEYYKMFKDHKVYGWYDIRTPVLIVKDLDMAKDIMVKHFKHFTDRRVPVEHDAPFKDNLLTLKGDKWKRIRSIITPTFSSGRLKKMAPHVERNAKLLLENLRRKQESGEEIELRDACSCFALDVIASIGFGLDINTLGDPSNTFAKEARNCTNPNILLLVSLLFFPELRKVLRAVGLAVFPKKSMEYLARAVDVAIEGRRRDGSAGKLNDFLDLVMNAEQEDGEGTREPLTRSELHSLSIMLIFGGLETISTVMSFTLFLLAVHPDCCLRAQKEIDDKIGKEAPSYDNVQQLDYLEMCLSEAMRMAPPGFILDRQCVEDVTIQGVHIPKGMPVLVPIYAIHNDPEIWPRPETFDPERFTPENKASRHPYAFLPFGQGPRNCIGMRLALVELKIALSTVLQKFTPVKCSKTVYPFNLSKTLLKANDGLWVKIEARK
ncbi:unnamed protein product [Lymnaea stagnalis]|uniref:Cytochrome P450 n=1 Tax=Lymnaea stagnalis TaxID=6523 RepID=A0AAV2IB74_LYMST